MAGSDGESMTPQRHPRELGMIVVPKGPGTTITAPSKASFIDTAGVPDLACAGSGDVLSGLMAGMLAHVLIGIPLVVGDRCGVAAWCSLVRRSSPTRSSPRIFVPSRGDRCRSIGKPRGCAYDGV